MLIMSLTKKKIKRICIILPNTSYPLLQLQSGLLTALEAYSQLYRFFPYQYCLFTLEDDFKNGVSDLFKRFATELYDIIFTIGTTCTQLVKTVCMMRRISTPVVFGGVLDPELVFLATRSTPLITGVKATAYNYYEHQIEILVMLVPQVKKVAILQDRVAASGSEVYAAQRIIELLARHGIDGQEVVIDDMNTWQTIITPYVPTIDLIIVLRRSIFMSRFQEIVRLACEQHVPIYSCDLSAVYRGAAIGFGDFDYKIGIEIVKKALPLLVEGGPSHDIPVSTVPWEGKVIINTAATQRQNLVINAGYAESMHSISFI
jgi:ABC-type uncharacterized transport system substrate-binding protein